jgi:CelD/BcsL family acetyltransferase involved in cellulose biosynthesis
MRAEIYTTDDIPSRLRDDWLRLAADDPTAGPDWRSAWWDVYGAGLEAALGVVYRDDTVVALAPWYVDRKPWLGRSLAAMGDGKACTDYQRILLEPTLSEADRAAVVRCLVEAYVGNRATARASAWTLEGIEPAEPSIGLVCGQLAAKGFDLTEEPLESSWVLELPQTWNEFTAGVHRSMRRKINKAARRVEQGEVRFETATTWESIDAAWEDFVRLHALRFRDRDAAGGCFADPRFGAFLRPAVRRLAERGAAELVWCRAENAIVAVQLFVLGGKTAFMYQSGIDPAQMQLEPGHLLYTHVIRRLIERGYERLDFLRGDEPYKADWGALRRPLVRLVAVSPRTAARVRYGAMRMLRDFKHKFEVKAAASAVRVADAPPAASNEVVEETNLSVSRS